MNPREMLTEPIAFLAPAPALEGLTAAAAEQRLPGANHSIAEIVAHLAFWQGWFVRRLNGIAEPMVERAADGWPTVAPGSWREVEEVFLGGLTRLVTEAERTTEQLDEPLTPSIAFSPLAHYSRRDVLVHVGAHNAHHLGQIILLRQILAAWPPPAGSWTW